MDQECRRWRRHDSAITIRRKNRQITRGVLLAFLLLVVLIAFNNNSPPRPYCLAFSSSSSAFPPSAFVSSPKTSFIGRSPSSPSPPYSHQRHSFLRRNSNTKLMGIRGFRSWFESQFGSAVTAFPTHYSSKKGKNKKGGGGGAGGGAGGGGGNNINNNNKQQTQQQPQQQERNRQQKDADNNYAHDSFDHVLIDVNQMLHTCIRKSRSDEHGLVLLLSELDTCLRQIRPLQSVVLAIDGPPSAAKLATQRKRRRATLDKTQFNLEAMDRTQKAMQLEKEQESNMISNKDDDGNSTTTSSSSSSPSITTAGTAPLKRWMQRRPGRWKKLTSKQWARQRRKSAAETRTLCITPGTEFMRKVEQTLLYWAWQRLDHQHFGGRKVRIYVSPSTVPGEGEVKLLEWLYHHKKSNKRRDNSNKKKKQDSSANATAAYSNESVALLGGDSDLILEALMLNPFSGTRDVFVLLPDGHSRYLCVSIWETTRELYNLVQRYTRVKQRNKQGGEAPPAEIDLSKDIIRFRDDLVFLFLLNGNDYLPKLRGSSGFDKLLSVYLKLQQSASDNGRPIQQPLVDPLTLEFTDTGIALFQRLASIAPPKKAMDRISAGAPPPKKTPLQRLHQFTDAGFLPNPMHFDIMLREEVAAEGGGLNGQVGDVNVEEELGNDYFAAETINGGEDEGEEEEGNDVNNADTVDDDRAVFVRLSLGDPSSEDYHAFEIWHHKQKPIKQTKQKLAERALRELLDWGGGNDDEDALNADSEEDDSTSLLGYTSSFYDWEIPAAVDGDVESYLYGLLWNLQTYQDGVCPDYAYNYGKRTSPRASEISSYLMKAKGRVGLQQLRSSQRHSNIQQSDDNTLSPPITAGLACLAALPAKVKHFVPKPYRWLSDETVEDIYANCMDPYDNWFDMRKFEKLCNDCVADLSNMTQQAAETINSKQGILDNMESLSKDNLDEHSTQHSHHGRRIFTSDHSWTLLTKGFRPLTHPFDPPEPFADRISGLRDNDRIRVSKVMAIQEPRPRAAALGDVNQHTTKAPTTDDDRSVRGKKRKKGFVKKADEPVIVEPSYLSPAFTSLDDIEYKVAYSQYQNKKKKSPKSKKKKKRKIKPPSLDAMTTMDGITAISCLKQLEASGVVGPINWDIIENSSLPITSPEYHECIRLRISKEGSNSILKENIAFELDRNINSVSRRLVKQHLASLALCALVGSSSSKTWTERTYRDLRSTLHEQSSAVT